MKAVAFSNNDMAVAAWTFGGRIPGCLGFAVYRTDVKAGVETCLPALATFPNQDPTKNRTTADDPVQKFFGRTSTPNGVDPTATGSFPWVERRDIDGNADWFVDHEHRAANS